MTVPDNVDCTPTMGSNDGQGTTIVGKGDALEGMIVTVWDETYWTLGTTGVIIGADYVDEEKAAFTYHGYLYKIVECTAEGTICGGIIQVAGTTHLRDTGKRFYDVAIPFDDDIPF